MKDCETNLVYATEALNRYPAVLKAMDAALREVGVELRLFYGTKNVWCRDWAPVQVGSHFVKFGYKGAGLGYEAFPQLEVPPATWNFLGPVVESPIILDGSNIVRYGHRVLMTEIVFKHNPQYERDELRKQLMDLLQAEIIFVPPEPGDDLGHTDGIFKWVDSHHVLMNDYRVMHDPVYRDYAHMVRGILRIHKIHAVPFPYFYDRCPELDEAAFRWKYPDADDLNPGWGYAINFLQVKGAILYPTFGIEDDEWTETCLWDAFPYAKLFPIDCADLSMEGGLVNCTTMNYCMKG